MQLSASTYFSIKPIKKPLTAAFDISSYLQFRKYNEHLNHSEHLFESIYKQGDYRDHTR